jgi:hypothetical protein
MRSEADTPNNERFLMLLGRLADNLIEELDSEMIPKLAEQMRDRGTFTPDHEAQLGRFEARTKTGETAIFTLYAYADIPLGRRYDNLWSRYETSECIDADCVVDHAIFNGLFPVEAIAHGHKHILFVRISEAAAKRLPTFTDWDQIGVEDWSFGLSDREVANTHRNANKASHSTADRA